MLPNLYQIDEWKLLQQFKARAESVKYDPYDKYGDALTEAVKWTTGAALSIDAAAPYYLGWSKENPEEMVSFWFKDNDQFGLVYVLADYLKLLSKSNRHFDADDVPTMLLHALDLLPSNLIKINPCESVGAFTETCHKVRTTLEGYFMAQPDDSLERRNELMDAFSRLCEISERVGNSFIELERRIANCPGTFVPTLPVAYVPNPYIKAFYEAKTLYAEFELKHEGFRVWIGQIAESAESWKRNHREGSGWLDLYINENAFNDFFGNGSVKELALVDQLEDVRKYGELQRKLNQVVIETRIEWQKFISAVMFAVSDPEISRNFMKAASALYEAAENVWNGKTILQTSYRLIFDAFAQARNLVTRHFYAKDSQEIAEAGAALSAAVEKVANLPKPQPTPEESSGKEPSAQAPSVQPVPLSIKIDDGKTGPRLLHHKHLCAFIVYALEHIRWERKQELVKHRKMAYLPVFRPPSTKDIADYINAHVLELEKGERDGKVKWLEKSGQSGTVIKPESERSVRQALENAMGVRLSEITEQFASDREMALKKMFGPKFDRDIDNSGIDTEEPEDGRDDFQKLNDKDDDVENGGQTQKSGRITPLRKRSATHRQRKRQMARKSAEYRDEKVMSLYMSFFSVTSVMMAKLQGRGDGDVDIPLLIREISEREAKRLKLATTRSGFHRDKN